MIPKEIEYAMLDCQPKSQDDAVYVSIKWRDAVIVAANAPLTVNMDRTIGRTE